MKRLLSAALALLAAVSLWATGLERLNPTTVEATLDGGQRLYFDFYGPSIFRVFQDPAGGPLRDPVASPPAQILVKNPRRDVKLQFDAMLGRVETSAITLKIDAKNGQFTVEKGGRTIVAQAAPTEFMKGKVRLALTQQPDANFYGGGVQNGRFSHRGRTIQIRNTNNWVDGGVASPCPFYWSTQGYGLMAYTFAPGSYDFGETDAAKTVVEHETPYLDLFVMVDDGAVALLNDFYQLTGNPVLLPKFGFYEGHLNAYNRDYWTPAENGSMLFEDGKRYAESQKDNGGIKESLNGEKQNYQFSARAAIDRYLDNDMPLGWFLPNDGYGAGYGQTETLDGNIANLKAFGDYARQKGVEIGLWTQSDLHPKAGIEALLQRDIVKEVRDAGVRVLKTDVAWVGAGYSFGLNGVSDVGEIMPYYGHDARPFIISLDGWAGTQRYAGIWSGDQTGGEWEYIRFHIPTYIGAGLSGQPNITSDMDGIFGGRNLPVNVRDFQWKAFSPMQLNMDGWGSNPKYPQALGEPATSINRWYLKLKSRLLPYTYSIAREAVDGRPMMRAMFLEEENAYTLGRRTQYQFMYGPYILVAPIYKETRADKDGNDVRDGIYLPRGEWVDYFTGEPYEGGRILNDYAAPLWKLPILVKRGAIIPTHKPTNNVGQMDPHLRQYTFYPGQGMTTFTEYDDDGRTQAYLANQCVTTALTQQTTGTDVRLQVAPAKGTYEGYEPVKSTQLVVYCAAQPTKIVVRAGKRKIALTAAPSYAAYKQTPNSYYFGKSDVEHMDATALWMNIEPMNVAETGLEVTLEGVTLAASTALTHHGTLSAPRATLEGTEAYTLTPKWEAQQEADYYELEFEGQTYSTIRQTQYTIDDLQPVTGYTLRLRSVNADGPSPWTELKAQTATDPLEHAIRGARATTSCDNQGGQGANHLVDFDETSVWHTKWGQEAVPFDLVIDLHSVNQLDRLQYIPRGDAANGTLLRGTVEYSLDRKQWTKAEDFTWPRTGEAKEIAFPAHPTARFIRFHVTEAVGKFGSGMQIYTFRVPGSEWYIPGDINQDKRIDENDLTSYLNYTGLRQGDGDFAGYISKGDLNQNGLIDAYDISAVAIELETGVSSRKVPEVAGTVTATMDKTSYKAGDDVTLTLTGHGLVSVNALSCCVPYDADEYEYVGLDAPALADMYNMTYDRLHTDGHKALYPTFVNLGEQKYAEGDLTLVTLHFRARRDTKTPLKVTDGMLVDKYQNVVEY